MHSILKSAALAGLFLVPVAPILSFSTDAQAEDCSAPLPSAVLCEDFAVGDPLDNSPASRFVVATPVTVGVGQSAMNVGIDSQELFFRHISGFGTADAHRLSASPLSVINKRLEGDVLFQSGAVNPRSAAAITWGEGGQDPQTRIGFSIQIDENKVDFGIAVDGVTQINLKTDFASTFDTTYRLSLVTLGPDRIQGFIDGVMIFDVPFDLSLLPASLLPGFVGNSRGVELRFDNLLVSNLIRPVDIDIKPGSFPNSINLGSGGATPVAILGSAQLDVSDIDTDTLTLGTAGIKTVGKRDHQLCSIEDVSGDFIFDEGSPDGFPDLVCHFITMEISPEAGNTSAKLSGSLLPEAGGGAIEGTDSVNIVP